MVIRQLSVFVENRTGSLYEISDILVKNGIDIRAISLSDTVEFGILRLIVSDPERAEAALKEKHFVVTISKVLGVLVEDAPGGLQAVLKLLMDEEIPVEYVYAFISKSESASVILYVKEPGRAEAVLRKNGVKLLDGAY